MPSTYPPECHFGYICCKCKKSDFLGRRYACWLCINYQLCGQCYDSGVLPVTADHNYFHPLEAYYTRAEYELYFGGEHFVESYVPQSYKCALCDDCGFTSLQLYKHLSDVHRNHSDFEEYFSILYTRYATEFMPAHSAGPTSNAAGDVQLITGVVESPRSSQNSAVGVREAMRMTQARQALLLEQQALNVLEELRVVNRSNSCLSLVMRTQELDQQLQQQQQPQRLLRAPQVFADVASARTSKTVRVRKVPSGVRLCPLVPKVTPRRDSYDSWTRYWAASAAHQQWNELDFASYAETVRSLEPRPESPETKKPEKKSDLHKFLCAKFMNKMDNLPEDAETMAESSRTRFAQAVLCSMLTDDNLKAIELQPSTMQLMMEAEPTGNKGVVQSEQDHAETNPSTSDGCADNHMERFYRGLDNYKKWFAEFMAKKLEVKSKEIEVEPLISDVPNIFFQATNQSNIGIDSDADTDEREDDDDADYKIESVQIRECGQQADVEVPIQGQVVEEVAEDEENAEEYEDDDYGDNSGSETSDSSIAMMIYGY